MVLLFYSSAEKTSQRYIEYARRYLCLRRNFFLISRFLLELDVALIFLLRGYLRCPFLVAYRSCRLSPIALLYRSFCGTHQSRTFGPVYSLAARRLLPSSTPLNPFESRIT